MLKRRNKKNNSNLPEPLIKLQADQIKKDKCSKGIAIWQQNHDDNLLEAKNYLKSHPLEVLKWRLNQPLIFLEKKLLEPLDALLKRSAIFSIFEQASPILEAIGIIAIPFVIWCMGQQEEQSRQEIAAKIRQQEAIKGYVNQLTQMLLNWDIEKDQKSKDLRRIIETNTLLILSSPNLDTNGKGEIITFLSKLNLITDTNLLDEQKSLISLSKADLQGAWLSEVYLLGANLSKANLFGANLQRAYLSEANLFGANLQKANLFGANLQRAYFLEANLLEANLSGANLFEANLSKTNLSKTNLSEANLSGANLSEAKPSGANLSGVNLFEANLSGANLSEANLSGANLSEANLSGANLFEANLSKTNLSKTNLSKTNFKGAYLQGAYLYQTKFLNIKELKSAYNWKKAIYTEATWDSKKLKWVPIDKEANKAKIQEMKDSI